MQKNANLLHENKNTKNERADERKQWEAVRIKLRAGGDLHGPEKPRWIAGDMEEKTGKVQSIMIKKQI